jgi:ABC-type Mn2+/Zn2+ transport system ATPase subunit
VSRIDLVRSTDIAMSVRTRQVASMFDLEARPTEERWSFDFRLPDDWNVGLIIGPSGSGKTTVARELFSHAFVDLAWPDDGSIIDGFDKTTPIKDVTEALSSVGFSSPPSWLRPYRVLSNGQQFRANVARLLTSGQDIVAMDEFTSVVDRTVAQVGSSAVAKAVRRRGGRFVAVSCHYDIIEWMQPDWVLTMPDGVMTRRSVQRRPDVELHVTRVDRSAWDTFRRHHYLDHGIHKAAACYLAAWNGRPVAFASALSFPHATCPGWREHRTVCLPDFQGVGIGNAVSGLVAAAYSATGKPYYSATSHPAMIRYRARSKDWMMTRHPSRESPTGQTSSRPGGFGTSSGRFTAAFRWTGIHRPDVAKAWGLL